jgi:RHS repeat-associated protein
LATTVWYISDAGGNLIASHEINHADATPTLELTDQTLYGKGRVGFTDRTTADGDVRYEITDNLGNVRATIARQLNGGEVQLLSMQDFYPYGMPLPGQTLDGDHRFGYQGQETDDETGFVNFELRQYDPRLGRWLSVDPYGQHHSPYLAMSNNPVLFIDPDGGWANGAGHGNTVNPEDEGTAEGADISRDNIAWLHAVWGGPTAATYLEAHGYGAASGYWGMMYVSEGRSGGVLYGQTVRIEYLTERSVLTDFYMDFNDVGNATLAGFVDNLIGTRIRKYYNAYDTDLYNRTLDKVDKLSLVLGTGLMVMGAMEMLAGGGLAATGVGAPIAVPVAGAALLSLGVGGLLIGHASSNISEGNNFGSTRNQFAKKGKNSTNTTNKKGAPSEVNKELERVKSGNGTRRTNKDTGEDATFNAKEFHDPKKKGFKNQEKWEGAKEWDVPNGGAHDRILELELPDGTKRYGWSDDINYKRIHDLN